LNDRDTRNIHSRGKVVRIDWRTNQPTNGHVHQHIPWAWANQIRHRAVGPAVKVADDLRRSEITAETITAREDIGVRFDLAELDGRAGFFMAFYENRSSRREYKLSFLDRWTCPQGCLPHVHQRSKCFYPEGKPFGLATQWFGDCFYLSAKAFVLSCKPIRQEYFERLLGAQHHCSQNVLLGIKSSVPAWRIIPRKEDIMDLNNDARLKARQQFKKEHRYIRI
jgi:hypothetical protein